MAQMISLLNLQGQLALLVCIGMLLRRTGMIDAKAKKFLTDLVIHLILPFNIIQSFRMPSGPETMQRTFAILMISIAVHIGYTVFAVIGFRKLPRSRSAVIRFGIISSNAGFLGNPLAEGIFGSEGLLLSSVFQVPQRILQWSAGIGFYTEEDSAGKPRWTEVLRKAAAHPCILAVVTGMILMVTQLPLPEFLGNTIKSIGSCNTALSMLLIGAILWDSGSRDLLSRDVLLYCLIRLVLLPGAVLLFCRALSAAGLVTGVSVLLAAMPMGGTTAILAEKYGCDAPFAAKCIAVSTVLSLLTTPLWFMVL